MLNLREKSRNFYSYLRELNRVALLSAAAAVVPIAISTMLLPIAPAAGNLLRDNWETGAVVYVLFVWLVCGFALLPTNVIGILCGWAFGFPLGICLHMTGIVGASLISKFVLAPLAGNNFQDFLENHDKAKVLYKSLLRKNFKRTTLIITLLRLSPAMPFALTNLLMAAARVPLFSFLSGTFIGMIPRSSAVVFFGAGVSEIDLSEPFNVWMLILGWIATIISIVVIGYFSKKTLARVTVGEA